MKRLIILVLVIFSYSVNCLGNYSVDKIEMELLSSEKTLIKEYIKVKANAGINNIIIKDLDPNSEPTSVSILCKYPITGIKTKNLIDFYCVSDNMPNTGEIIFNLNVPADETVDCIVSFINYSIKAKPEYIFVVDSINKKVKLTSNLIIENSSDISYENINFEYIRSIKDLSYIINSYAPFTIHEGFEKPYIPNTSNLIESDIIRNKIKGSYNLNKKSKIQAPIFDTVEFPLQLCSIIYDNDSFDSNEAPINSFFVPNSRLKLPIFEGYYTIYDQNNRSEENQKPGYFFTNKLYYDFYIIYDTLSKVKRTYLKPEKTLSGGDSLITREVILKSESDKEETIFFRFIPDFKIYDFKSEEKFEVAEYQGSESYKSYEMQTTLEPYSTKSIKYSFVKRSGK